MNDERERRTNARKWLASQGLRSLSAGIGVDELKLLQRLVGGEAFGLLWSLIAEQRAQALIALSNTPLGTPVGVAAASVLQGQIRGIDQIRETLLDIADPQFDEQQEEGQI